MKIVYIDVLFFINTAANYLLLLATAKICDTKVSRIAMAISACLGGVYSVFSAIPGYEVLNTLPIKAAAGGVMLLIVFGKQRGWFRIAIVFFAVSAAMGGILYAISGGVHIGIATLAIVFVGGFALVSAAFRRTAGTAPITTVKLCITCFGKSCECNALVDTGNSLKDPISGIGAAIVSSDRIFELFPKKIISLIKNRQPADAMASLSGTEYAVKFCLLPYSAVGVERGILLAVRPDSVTVNGKQNPGMLAAISPNIVSDGGAYSALVGISNT